MSRRSGRVLIVTLVAIAVGVQGLPVVGAEFDTPPPARRAKHLERIARDAGSPALRMSTEGHKLSRADEPQDAISLLRENGGVTQPTAWVATIEDLVEQHHDIDVVNPLGDVDTDPDGSVASHEETTYRDAAAAGDLDGDGLDDVAVLETSYTPGGVTMDVAAIRGIDGAELWRRTVDQGSGLAIPVGDFSGDGFADLLVLSLEVSGAQAGTCLPLFIACAITDDSTWMWTSELLSGSDGATLWSRQQPGGVEEVYAFAWPVAAVALADVYRATGVLVVPMLGADRDGDGAGDIVENVVDVEGELFLAAAPFVLGLYSREQTATTASVLSGRDGAAGGPLQTEMRDGVSLLLPAGRSVGDGTPDLLWTDADWSAVFLCAVAVLGACIYEETASARLVDGATLEVAWVTDTYDSNIYVTPLEDDLDGDGSDDVLVEDWWYGVSVLSGATGSSLWDAGGWSLGTVGSIDGDGRADVLAVRGSYAFDADSGDYVFTIHVDRRDGGTGELLFSTATEIRETEDEYAYVSVGLVGDGDGDGVDDLGVTTERYDFATGDSTTTGRVESSVSGDEIIHTPAIPGGFPTPLIDAGDLDGDGRDDVVIVVLDWDSQGDHLSIAAVGGDGPLWDQTVIYDWLSWLDVRSGNHLTDASSDDVLIVRDVYDGQTGRTLSRVDALDGGSGAAMWGVGDSLPDSETFGSISGTVVDLDGNQVDGLCVGAYDATGSQVAGMYVTQGTFSLTRLPVGEYRLQLVDCELRYNGTRTWYELKDSFEDADVIALAEGEEITGVTATFPFEISRPPNDAFAEAEPWSFGTHFSNSVNATLEDGEPRPCGFIGSTVWFAYTAPSDGAVVVATNGSSFDTVLAAYTGTTLDGLDLVQCNDDTAPDLTSALTFTVEAGTTYLIQAGGYQGDAGNLVLTIAGAPN